MAAAFPVSLVAQAPVSDALQQASRAAEAGHVREAWDLLRSAPESEARTTLQVRVAAEAGWLPEAVAAYDRLRMFGAAEHEDLLQVLATAAARRLRADPDVSIHIEACRALFAAGPDSTCAEDMRRLAADAKEPAPIRLRAAAALTAVDTAAAARLASAVRRGTSDTLAQADAMSQFPPDIAGPVLLQLLQSSDGPTAYAAALAVAKLQPKGAVVALRALARRRTAGAGPLGATIGLAVLGDANGLKQARELLPFVGAGDRLLILEALAAHGDRDAITGLHKLMSEADEMTALDAAAAILRSEPDARDAARTLERGMASPNASVRARALERLGNGPLRPRARASLLDADPWVAVRASQALLRRPTPR